MPFAVGPETLVVPLVIALIAAVGSLAGVIYSTRKASEINEGQLRLNAEELETNKEEIIRTAEDRATGRALEALQIALTVTEKERDRALSELRELREENKGMRDRLSKLESVVERRLENHEGHPSRRSEDL